MDGLERSLGPPLPGNPEPGLPEWARLMQAGTRLEEFGWRCVTEGKRLQKVGEGLYGKPVEQGKDEKVHTGGVGENEAGPQDHPGVPGGIGGVGGTVEGED